MPSRAFAGISKVTLPDASPQKTDYWLTRKEVADRIRVARRSYATRHLARMLLIGVCTGTRPGAILGLKWMASTTSGHFDIHAEILHRRGALSSRQQEAPAARQDPRGASAAPAAFKGGRRKIGCTDVIHFRARRVVKVYEAWNAVAKRAGATRKDAPHIIRHTAATWQMQAGTDLYEAAGYLGMSPKTLLEVYGHHHPDFQTRAASAVSPKATKRDHAHETPRKPRPSTGTKGNPDVQVR